MDEKKITIVDIHRALDYLTTRSDIDCKKLVAIATKILLRAQNLGDGFRFDDDCCRQWPYLCDSECDGEYQKYHSIPKV